MTTTAFRRVADVDVALADIQQNTNNTTIYFDQINNVRVGGRSRCLCHYRKVKYLRGIKHSVSRRPAYVHRVS